MKYFYTILISIICQCLLGQSPRIIFTGTVLSEDKQPLIGATILIEQSHEGTQTDKSGTFKLTLGKEDSILLVSYVGHQALQLNTNYIQTGSIIILKALANLEEVEVVGSSTFLDQVTPIQTEVLTKKELQKAPCCNLSESFETNASVDVTLTDAISGAKQIRMLGLDGTYVQITRENSPILRGLNGQFGLSQIPGSWIQSIDIGKGAGSVVNGFESMTGQLNVELKKSLETYKLFLNSYMNSFGRYEVNANYDFNISKHLNSLVMIHQSGLGTAIDGNNDGYRDLPEDQQTNILSRWKLKKEKLISHFGIQLVRDRSTSGHISFNRRDNPSTSPVFGYHNLLEKAVLFGKTGWIFPHQPRKGIGIQYATSITKIDAEAGRRQYLGNQQDGYINLIYQNILGNTFHEVKTGLSLSYDNVKENYRGQVLDTLISRTEIIPGLFGEYTFTGIKKLSLVFGGRADYSNLFGAFITPRFHAKYTIKNSTTIRTSIGAGRRNPVVIAENMRVLNSSRRLVFNEKISQERSTNYGISLQHHLTLLKRKLVITTDVYRTTFGNRAIADFDRNPQEVHFINTVGTPKADAFQCEISYTFKTVKLKSAYKRYDVSMELDGRKQQAPLVARNRFFLNIGWEDSKGSWQADATWNFVGPKRLPNTQSNPSEFRFNSSSPSFSLVSMQLQKHLKWGQIYFGGENLLGFRQEDVIINSENPFGSYFDGSIAWGPLTGRMYFLGFRYKIVNDENKH